MDACPPDRLKRTMEVLDMLKLKNDYGMIIIDDNVVAGIASIVASDCFGIAQMEAKNVTEQIWAFLKKDRPDKGVHVYTENNKVVIDIHIAVMYGVNIPAITDSISHKITYSVSDYIGVPVDKVNVFVDSVITK